MIVGAITLETSNLEKLCSFYALALEVSDDKITKIEGHRGFMLENTYLGFDNQEETRQGGNTIIWFRTEKVSKLFDSFVQAGASIRYKPNIEMSPGEILAEVLDPELNRIGIIGPA